LKKKVLWGSVIWVFKPLQPHFFEDLQVSPFLTGYGAV
jgi:hypothetical protein